ncbi:hypothetical protein [Neoroseomonas lacus]|uniref:Uncharacterized protein n=1 Tax=Neoroseomonas lacus TaxID=287609 RepID=A0A917NNH3_9PROT|nr:hypothetical protein [Neoroseomonas lacus]GGJ14012.1 hypothetical protein GCM10011320_21590 [Neoroseomonas lacus]
MPDTPSVPSGFDTLMDALAAEALTDKAKFQRAAAFRMAVERLAERWTFGAPPHTPKKAKAGAPAAGPEYPAASEV